MSRFRFVPLLFCLAVAACASGSLPAQQKAEILAAHGKALLAAGQNAEARDTYQTAVDQDDENARAWNGLGVADDLLGKHDEALDAYKNAADLSPGDLNIVNNLGHAYLEAGDAESAAQVLAPHEDDPKAPAALKQNLAKATALLQTRQDAENEIYAELGAYPTEGMARGRLKEIRGLLSDPDRLTFTVVPDVKVAGGTLVFVIHATGKPPQEICDELTAQAFPCITHAKQD